MYECNRCERVKEFRETEKVCCCFVLTSLIVSTQEKATDVRCADSMGPIQVPPIQMPQVMVRDWPSPKIEEVMLSFHNHNY
jgi:hypothetical protein